MVRQVSIKRFLSGIGAFVLIAGVAAQAILPDMAHAAPAVQITNRTLLLEPGTTCGGSWTGTTCAAAAGSLTVNHKFTFTLNDTTDNLGAMVFQYCTTAAAVPNGLGCAAPVGINTTAVSLGTVSGATGWTAATEQGLDDAADTVNNGVLLTRTPAPLGAVTPVTIELDGIVNPTAVNTTFYVRIWTFSSNTPTITPAKTALVVANTNDAGTVAASTAYPINLSGTMPESLVFCTGATVDISTITTLPNCSTATIGTVAFNQLFDPNTTSWATSQMAASTNAGQGYQITVQGATMTSGSNTITPMAAANVSIPGTAQFGLNLIDDKNPTAPIVTDPTIGTASADPITYYNGDSAGTGGAINPVSNGTSFFALPNTGFDGSGGAGNAPTYSFTANTPNTVAKSNYGGTLMPTNSQRYTATYIVNVPGNQPAGSYTTTLTYICTATY